jgi:hypothetical protein
MSTTLGRKTPTAATPASQIVRRGRNLRPRFLSAKASGITYAAGATL